ncbi:hypothetical protein ABTL74_19485, partial [Acinetobacter baumannii]
GRGWLCLQSDLDVAEVSRRRLGDSADRHRYGGLPQCRTAARQASLVEVDRERDIDCRAVHARRRRGCDGVTSRDVAR